MKREVKYISRTVAEAVLEEIADLSVGETAPVELLHEVQEWQERLTE